MPSSKLPSLGFSLLNPEGWEAVWGLQCSQMTSPVCHQISPSGTGQSSFAVEYCSGFQWTGSLETWEQSPRHCQSCVCRQHLQPYLGMELPSSCTDLPHCFLNSWQPQGSITRTPTLTPTTSFSFESTTLYFSSITPNFWAWLVFSPQIHCSVLFI